MSFYSILFARPEDRAEKDLVEAPDFFIDLNLDQIIDAVAAIRSDYDLKPFFYAPLNNIDAVNYRQEIARELENCVLWENIKSFAQKMRTMRRRLAAVDGLYYKYNKQGLFLDAVDAYCSAVADLAHDLSVANLQSRGFQSFREYITSYTGSTRFTALAAQTRKLKADLSAVRYFVHIKGNRVSVRRHEAGVDYSKEVEQTFEKFKQGAVKDYTVELPVAVGMNHVEAQILDGVAKLYPGIFADLENYCAEHSNFTDETIKIFDREIQFYIAFLDYISKLKQAGLKFCYPQISGNNKEVYDFEGFDLALAHKLITEGSSVVPNDFHLKGKERIIVVSGPNQGGKTTFARTFGQLHYLAALGLPVPGRKARLFLSDRVFTHFERAENIENLRGKLEDDLVRIYEILRRTTTNSIIIINEILTSTTLKDAVFLGTEVLKKIIELDLLCVCVTFIDELASLSEKTVSMVSTVDPENPTVRTYRIVRRPANGLSYAFSIAEKYRVTYDCLKERIKT